jgi:transmembrane sensor
LLSRKGNCAGIRNTCMKPHKGRIAKGSKKAFLEENFNDQQWVSHEPEGALPEGKSEEMFLAVQEGIAAGAAAKQIRRLRVVQLSRYLSAACVIIIVGLALFLGNNNPGVKHPARLRSLAANRVHAAAESIWSEESNTSASLRKVRLPDSSLVTIYPGSNIRFEKKFDHTFRNVYLQGKAKFKVKPNTRRPFSVYSGVLKTTALGTSFTINTAASGNRISVKLHTGKIVITDTTARHPLAYISTVGSTLLYNPAAKLVRIINVPSPKDAAVEFMKREGDVLMMKNIPLVEVIRLLNEAYAVQILVNSANISSITFTGQVDTRKDRIEDVLSMICTINNMTLTQVSPQEFKIQ